MGIHESFVAADGKLLQSFATSGTGTWIALATNRCSWNGKLQALHSIGGLYEAREGKCSNRRPQFTR